MTKMHRDTITASMTAAYQAGMDYWERNKVDATRAGLTSVAQSCGWHGGETMAWLSGFYTAKSREAQSRNAIETRD